MDPWGNIYSDNGKLFKKVNFQDVKNNEIKDIFEKGTFFLRIEDHNVRALKKITLNCPDLNSKVYLI